jgi:CheY-like chemotaxis protein
MSSTCTILLVEDNQSDVFLVERAFQKAKVPHLLQVVEDGEQAVAYLSGAGPYSDRSRFPLPVFVLLDLKLPRQSGFEVLEWLRRQPAIRRLPVVVLTSSNHIEDIDRAYDSGANSYLVKVADPIAVAELARAIEQYWVNLNQQPELG